MITPEVDLNLQCRICRNPLPFYSGHGRPRAYCPPPPGKRYSKCEEEARRQAKDRFDENEALNSESRKAQQRSRKFLERLRHNDLSTVPSWLVAIYLGDSSSTKTARYEQFFERLQHAQQHLVSGQIAPGVVATDIEALQSSLAFLGDKDATTARLYISGEEILRDLGEQGDSAEAYQQLVQRCLKVERYWVLQKEPLQLAKALLTHVAVLRIEIDRNPNNQNSLYRTAMRLLTVIEHVLRKQGRKRDAQATNRLHHHAVALKLRLIAHHEETLGSASRERKLLRYLATSLNSPQTWLSTYQEEAAALLLCGEYDEAAEYLEETRQLLTKHPASLSLQAQLALLRREIELQLIKRKLPEAQLLIHTYHQVLQKYPNAYYLRHLNRWIHKYHLLPISQSTLSPAYSTGMVYHFYYEGELLS